MKLTEEQIQLIDNAIIKAGISYIDIRMELTDHIAAALEQKDERFEHHLKGYILKHKSELKKINRRFILIAMGKTCKQLFINVLKPLYIIVAAATCVAGCTLNSFFGRPVTILTLFLIYTLICCLVTNLSGASLINATFNRKKQYSYSSGFSFIYVLLYYPTMQLFLHEEYFSDIMLVFCFTVAITLSLAMYVTARQFNKRHKLQYHA